MACSPQGNLLARTAGAVPRPSYGQGIPSRLQSDAAEVVAVARASGMI